MPFYFGFWDLCQLPACQSWEDSNQVQAYFYSKLGFWLLACGFIQYSPSGFWCSASLAQFVSGSRAASIGGPGVLLTPEWASPVVFPGADHLLLPGDQAAGWRSQTTTSLFLLEGPRASSYLLLCPLFLHFCSVAACWNNLEYLTFGGFLFLWVKVIPGCLWWLSRK